MDPFHCIHFDALSKLKFIIAYEMNWSAIWIWGLIPGKKNHSLSLSEPLLMPAFLFHVTHKVLSLCQQNANKKKSSFFLHLTGFLGRLLSLHTKIKMWIYMKLKAYLCYRDTCAMVSCWPDYLVCSVRLILCPLPTIIAMTSPFRTKSTNVFISMPNKTILLTWKNRPLFRCALLWTRLSCI